MSWDYHRQSGEMHSLFPTQVSAVVRLYCQGSSRKKGELLHPRVVLGEIIRTNQGWKLGRGPHLTLRVFDNDKLVEDGAEERSLRNEKLADLIDIPGINSDFIRKRRSTERADHLDTGRAYWDREVAESLNHTALESRCPVKACMLHYKVRRMLDVGTNLDKFIRLVPVTHEAREPSTQPRGLSETLAPIWELEAHRLS